MRPFLTPVVLAALVFAAGPALAEEVQASFDAEGRLLELDAARARQLGVLGEYPALAEARLYTDTESGTHTLEVTELREGRRVRRRQVLSQEEVQALRTQVTAGLQAAPATPAPARASLASAPTPVDQSGRWALIGASTLMGASFYGWALPIGFRVSDISTVVGMYMLTTGASFFVPFFVTAHTDTTWGMTAMLYAGGTRGPVHGLLLGRLFSPTAFPQQDHLLLASGLGLAEAIGGTVWAHASRMDEGTAHALMTGSDFGMAYGWGLYNFITGDSQFIPPGAAGAMLLGAAGGAVGGYFLAGVRRYTWGEAEAIRTAGLLGAFATAPIIAWSEMRDVRPISGLLLTGGTLGLLLGDYFLADKDYGVGEALLVDLGMVAGGLLGFGGAFIINPRTSDVRPALTASAVGAVGGFVLAAALMSTARDLPQGTADVRLHLNPLALVAPPAGASRVQGPANALVGLSGRFD